MSRRKKLLSDLEATQDEYSMKGAYMKDFRLEDESLFFAYDNGKNRVEFTLHLNDYPDSTLVFYGNDSKSCSGTLPSIVKELLKEQNTKHGIKALTQSRDDISDEEMEDEDMEDEDEDDDDDSKWRNESVEDLDDDLKDIYEQENAYKEHDELTVELNNYKNIFGDKSVATKPMPLLETVDVEISLPYRDILEESVCNAWGIDPTLPIIMRLTFSSDYYLDAQKEPKLEIFQAIEVNAREKKKFKLKYQLEAILNQVIREQWPSNSNKKIKAVEYVKPKNTLSDSKNNNNNTKSTSFVGKLFGSNNSNVTKNDSWVSHLVDMGFSTELARKACQVSASLEEATNLLLTNPDSLKSVQDETPVSTGKSEIGRVDDIFQNPNKALTSEKKPGHIDTKYGFLAMITNYIRQRLSTLNNYCIICDNPHVFATGNMLKPAVCSRELCVFSFQQLGVAGEAADEIATAAEVVDLLVCFATIAAKSPRNQLIFDPYPTIVDPINPKRYLFNPNSKELDKVVQVLSKFPSVEQMCQAKDFSDMKKKMDHASELAFPLLQWIISSNRSYLVKLNKDKQIKSMETGHQYLLLSAPPEKEAKFKQLKQQHGSTFAFHGSSIENWHSIMRQGLRNASGTKLQMNGAAYGAGIYLSPHAGTSFGYCRMYGNTAPPKKSDNSGNRFLDSSNINCIAICEVIDKDIRKSGSIWVQPNEDYVVTRFFFVYIGQNVGSASNCSTEDSKFKNEILRAIAN